MSETEKDSKRTFHLVYAQADSELIAELAEGLKSDGDEVVSRIHYKRDYAISPNEVATLRERFDYYLDMLDDPRPMPMQPRLFISYAREDYQFIRDFASSFNKLNFMGIKTWIDVEDIVDKNNWMDELFEAISSCCGFVYVKSRNTDQSEVVSAELGFIFARMARRSGIFLCMALLDKLDVKLSVPIIHLYGESAEEAAKSLRRELFSFYRAYESFVKDLEAKGD